ncbi:hypothetical protein [Mesomycoplasma lagogenitalium]|uniref:Uncharacterized protein n=1 Tax=Mesomycoplasma lagogenitalium TaxID=171286 RepID=A0ABY8LWB4_9BACT|nr:hypothetical protein [Mesomycoplasma lagogenitalium]WGI36417.1 hypothetical protein QEG99_03025 [Mesomycoplasma lagogenitalium]
MKKSNKEINIYKFKIVKYIGILVRNTLIVLTAIIALITLISMICFLTIENADNHRIWFFIAPILAIFVAVIFTSYNFYIFDKAYKTLKENKMYQDSLEVLVSNFFIIKKNPDKLEQKIEKLTAQESDRKFIVYAVTKSLKLRKLNILKLEHENEVESWMSIFDNEENQ